MRALFLAAALAACGSPEPAADAGAAAQPLDRGSIEALRLLGEAELADVTCEPSALDPLALRFCSPRRGICALLPAGLFPRGDPSRGGCPAETGAP